MAGFRECFYTPITSEPGLSTGGLPCVVGGKDALLAPAFLQEKCTSEMDRIEAAFLSPAARILMRFVERC